MKIILSFFLFFALTFGTFAQSFQEFTWQFETWISFKAPADAEIFEDNSTYFEVRSDEMLISMRDENAEFEVSSTEEIINNLGLLSASFELFAMETLKLHLDGLTCYALIGPSDEGNMILATVFNEDLSVVVCVCIIHSDESEDVAREVLSSFAIKE